MDKSTIKRCFIIEAIQMKNKHIKIYSCSLVIRKIQIKTTTGYQNILNKMSKIQIVANKILAKIKRNWITDTVFVGI